MLTSLANSLRQALNRANVQSLPVAFQQVQLGDVMRFNLRHTLRGRALLAAGAAAAYPYTIQASAGTMQLPDDAKADALATVYARAGTGTLGLLTIDTTGNSAPAAGHCKISGSGDIIFASADAWTSVDVTYHPVRNDVIELILPVVPGTGICTLPANANGQPALYCQLLEAEALAGSVVGKSVVNIPGTAAATASAALNLAKTQVVFLTADAVTSCRVKLGIACKVDLDALLEGASQLI